MVETRWQDLCCYCCFLPLNSLLSNGDLLEERAKELENEGLDHRATWPGNDEWQSIVLLRTGMVSRVISGLIFLMMWTSVSTTQVQF